MKWQTPRFAGQAKDPAYGRGWLLKVQEAVAILKAERELRGLSLADISERTGLSVSNVGYRLHHILKELASKLRSRGIDGKS